MFCYYFNNSLQHNQNNFDMQTSPFFCFLMAVMLLLQQPVIALNWQGTGNLNNDNLTIIWNQIQTNLATQVNKGQLNTFSQKLSTTLNNQWNPAWNVVVVWITSTSLSYNDVVLYGYAFRNHWMWFNGYKDQALSGYQFSFVIWKDYNCQGWKHVGQNGDANGFSSAQQNKLFGWLRVIPTTDFIQNDPWGLAKSIVDTVQADTDFVVADNHAYSIVFGQDYHNSKIYGRVCEVANNHLYSLNGYGALAGEMGIFLLFQTR